MCAIVSLYKKSRYDDLKNLFTYTCKNHQAFAYRYILDGFPVNSKQVELMTAASVIPVRVIELECSNMEIMVRSTKDRLDPER